MIDKMEGVSVPANWAKKAVETKQQPWSKWQVIEAYKSGRFQVHALARLACCRANQVNLWVQESGWQPHQFSCVKCHKFTTTNRAQREAGDVRCLCGTSWKEGMDP